MATKPPNRNIQVVKKDRTGIREIWIRWRWVVFGLTCLLTIVLGYIGFAKLSAATAQDRTPADLFYLSLQLFTLESGSALGPKTWELEIARLLAPTLAAYALLEALAALFQQQAQSLRLRFMRNQIILCGLGSKGYILAKALTSQGNQVVILEQDAASPYQSRCQSLGAIVLHGNAADPAMLCKAGIHRAKGIIVVCGDDNVNAAVAVQVLALSKKRSMTKLVCTVHMVDPRLCFLLKQQELTLGEGASCRLELFNSFWTGAQIWLQEHPPADPLSSRAPHPLVVGLGWMGESLILHMAKAWQAKTGMNGEKLLVTIVDREAVRKVNSLQLRHPMLNEICRLEPLSMDVQGPEFLQSGFLFNSQGESEMTSVYICLQDVSLAFSTALILQRRLADERIPINVRTDEESGLAALLQVSAYTEKRAGNLHAFCLLDQTCRPELIFTGTHEAIAQALHEAYLASHPAADPAMPNNTPLLSWEELPESFRESCRRQADHISRKLEAVGCGLVPVFHLGASLHAFTPGQVEVMARMEHERWMAECRGNGWRLGARSLRRKTNPYLLPWEELPEDSKELNRGMIRQLPAMLARVDLQIHISTRENDIPVSP